MKNFISIILTIIFFSFFSEVQAQLKSNMYYLTKFAESSIDELADGHLKDKKILVEYHSDFGESYFPNVIQSKLTRSGADIVFDDLKADLNVTYMLKDASVIYDKVMKEGFLDEYFIERVINYKGLYQVNNKGQLLEENPFSYSVKDTVQYDLVSNIESPRYEFSKGRIPEESFWDSLLEPVVAVSTIILTIVLLFTVRSN